MRSSPSSSARPTCCRVTGASRRSTGSPARTTACSRLHLQDRARSLVVLQGAAAVPRANRTIGDPHVRVDRPTGVLPSHRERLFARDGAPVLESVRAVWHAHGLGLGGTG